MDNRHKATTNSDELEPPLAYDQPLENDLDADYYKAHSLATIFPHFPLFSHQPNTPQEIDVEVKVYSQTQPPTKNSPFPILRQNPWTPFLVAGAGDSH